MRSNLSVCHLWYWHISILVVLLCIAILITHLAYISTRIYHSSLNSYFLLGTLFVPQDLVKKVNRRHSFCHHLDIPYLKRTPLFKENYIRI